MKLPRVRVTIRLMKRNKYRLVLLVALLLGFTIVLAVAKRKYFKHSGVPQLAITIYNGNFAFVKERTKINLHNTTGSQIYQET